MAASERDLVHIYQSQPYSKLLMKMWFIMIFLQIKTMASKRSIRSNSNLILELWKWISIAARLNKLSNSATLHLLKIRVVCVLAIVRRSQRQPTGNSTHTHTNTPVQVTRALAGIYTAIRRTAAERLASLGIMGTQSRAPSPESPRTSQQYVTEGLKGNNSMQRRVSFSLHMRCDFWQGGCGCFHS